MFIKTVNDDKGLIVLKNLVKKTKHSFFLVKLIKLFIEKTWKENTFFTFSCDLYNGFYTN
jgi:hypothetical protein